MNPAHDLPPELLALVGDLLDERLDAAGRARLQTLLLENAAARTYYVTMLSLHVELEWRNDAPLSHWNELPLAEGVGEEETLVPATLAAGSLAAATSAQGAPDGADPATKTSPKFASPLLGFLNVLPDTIQPAHHPVRFLAVAATLTMLFWGVLALVVWPLGERGKLKHETAVAVNFTARVLHVQEVAWAEGQRPLLPGMTLNAGERVELQRGGLHLLFGAGARVAVEGPAALQVDGRGLMTLDDGRILARVEEKAVGFTVATPTVRVIDLGTEFGVEVRAQETEVQTFAGKVEVLRTSDPAQRPRVLAANEAAVFGNSPQQSFYVQEKKMNRMVYTGLAALLALPVADFARAVSIDVPNFSFENPASDVTTSTDGNTTTVPGWTYGKATSDLVGRWNFTSASFFPNPPLHNHLPEPALGVRAAFIRLGNGNGNFHGTLTTTTSLTTIEAKTIYTLTVAVGQRLDSLSRTMSIALLADGLPIPGASASIESSQPGNLLPGTVWPGTFQDLTASFSTALLDDLVGKNLTIQLTHSRTASHPNLGGDGVFDNVRLFATEVPPAPEPASGAALGLGGMLVLGLARRRGKK